MLSTIYQTLLVGPIFNILVLLYQIVGNLGVAIILLTLVIRSLLIPVVLPSLKNVKKQRDLQPELDKIKQKYKHDKKVQAQKQMELFQKHGINPASGCVTQLVMIIVLIALYSVIRQISTGVDLAQINDLIYFESLKFVSIEEIKTQFLYLNLAQPDPFFILAALSGLLQFAVSKMTVPYSEAGEKAAAKTPDKKDDVAYNVQNQMLYTMPIINFIIGTRLPAGVTLYLVTTTLFSLLQTYFVSGWGGLKPLISKIAIWKK